MEHKLKNLTDRMCVKTAIKKINHAVNVINEINRLTALFTTADEFAHNSKADLNSFAAHTSTSISTKQNFSVYGQDFIAHCTIKNFQSFTLFTRVNLTNCCQFIDSVRFI